MTEAEAIARVIEFGLSCAGIGFVIGLVVSELMDWWLEREGR